MIDRDIVVSFSIGTQASSRSETLAWPHHSLGKADDLTQARVEAHRRIAGGSVALVAAVSAVKATYGKECRPSPSPRFAQDDQRDFSLIDVCVNRNLASSS